MTFFLTCHFIIYLDLGVPVNSFWGNNVMISLCLNIYDFQQKRGLWYVQCAYIIHCSSPPSHPLFIQEDWTFDSPFQDNGQVNSLSIQFMLFSRIQFMNSLYYLLMWKAWRGIKLKIDEEQFGHIIVSIILKDSKFNRSSQWEVDYFSVFWPVVRSLRAWGLRFTGNSQSHNICYLGLKNIKLITIFSVIYLPY